MHLGIPKEIKPQEFRVGITPAGARELIANGHTVSVQSSAGVGIGFDDDHYRGAGARVLESAEAVYEQATLIVKVKEPQPEECRLLRPEHILFTYLHLAPDPHQAELLLKSGATCIAYETVTDKAGRLPLLAPMSEVAGRLSIQAAARCLEKASGGSGTLLGGVPGVPAAKVLVLGGGVVGLNAARMAAGLGAQVTLMDKSLDRLRYLDEVFGPRLATVYSTQESLELLLCEADAVIGAVLIPGAATPKLVQREHLTQMKPGSALVDVAIDQGGCFATSRPTTHQAPTYIVDGIVHYCVANMPGAVARTATLALTNATLPFVQALASKGLQALLESEGLLAGLNVANGRITHAQVAEALGKSCSDPAQAIKATSRA